jgi:hypothetical protein
MEALGYGPYQDEDTWDLGVAVRVDPRLNPS